MIEIKDLTFRYNSKEIFQKACVNINQGLKIGFVGQNGSGKTTLFKLIRKELTEDEGYITLPKKTTIGYVSQNLPDENTKLIDCVLSADEERSNLLIELEEEKTQYDRKAEIFERLNAIGAYSAKARASSLLYGLGFSQTEQEQSLKNFSGGWQMRVALARALFVRSDILLLDEPTNHLDVEASLWLESFLIKYNKTLIVISHDRELLNNVASSILYLEDKKLELFGGNYDAFEQNITQRKQLLKKQAKKQEQKKQHLQKYIDRFRYKANKAKQAQSKIKMLEKLEDIPAVINQKNVDLSFPKIPHLAPPLISLEKASFSYGENQVFKNINFRIDMDDKIALLGKNGNGKTTLVKILAKKLELKEGVIKTNKKLEIAYFAQQQTQELNQNMTAFEHIKQISKKETKQAEIKSYLARFGFDESNFENKVSELSGGEKAKLVFAQICHKKPHIIILDEPTNHLDIDSRKSLMSAINEFEGGIILITHDLFLINCCTDKLYLVADKDVKEFFGDIDDYKKYLLSNENNNKSDDDQNKKTNSKKQTRISAATKRKEIAPIKKQIKETEKNLSRLEDKKEEIQELLSDETLYERVAKEKIIKLQLELSQTQEQIEKNEMKWLELSEKIE